MKPPTKADSAILRNFADLAAELGFKSDQITDLKKYPGRGNAPKEHPQSRSNLVTAGKGVHISKRCGKPSTREFKEDRQFLFINHLRVAATARGQFKRNSPASLNFQPPTCKLD